VYPFIHQFRLLGSHQYPQSGLLLISFSTWETENRPVEINLDSTGEGGVKKCCNIFKDQKLANIHSFVGGSIIVQKNIENRHPFTESEEQQP
jgi:hypothetical protein